MLNTSVLVDKVRHTVYLPYKGYDRLLKVALNVLSCMKTNGFMREAKSYELSVILPTRSAAVEGVLVCNTRKLTLRLLMPYVYIWSTYS